jgi:acyl-CoA reductase-like NAD-dependent aldehyde dehydrogenase
MFSFKGHYIGGSFNRGTSKESIQVLHKYNQKIIAEIKLVDSSQIDAALESAYNAKGSVRSQSGEQRSNALAALATLISENKNTLIELIVAESGKPVTYATIEANRCITTLQVASREALTHTGELIPMEEGAAIGKTAYTKRFPIGVVVGISPFNFPLNLALHKIAPAIACGCPIIIKPSPFAPLSSFWFAELCEKVGLPKGAVNILLCSDQDASQLSTDPRVSLVSFTGSPAVGWKIKKSVEKPKVLLELGGNAGALIDEDANIPKVADQIAMGAFLYSGQICISTQRVFVLDNIFDAFKEKLISAVQNLKSGDPSIEETTIGPLIANVHYERIQNWVDEAVSQGASVLTGGVPVDKDRNLFSATVLTNTNSRMKVSSEEVFGPVLILEKVSSFEEGLNCLNDSRFGLQAGVFTNRIDKMKTAFESLQVGGVIINNVPGYRVDHMPYGGIKDSGLGREGLRYSMDEMTEPKLLVY